MSKFVSWKKGRKNIILLRCRIALKYCTIFSMSSENNREHSLTKEYIILEITRWPYERKQWRVFSRNVFPFPHITSTVIVKAFQLPLLIAENLMTKPTVIQQERKRSAWNVLEASPSRTNRTRIQVKFVLSF